MILRLLRLDRKFAGSTRVLYPIQASYPEYLIRPGLRACKRKRIRQRAKPPKRLSDLAIAMATRFSLMTHYLGTGAMRRNSLCNPS